MKKWNFEYSPLDEALSGKVKKDKENNKTDKIAKRDKQNKILVYNQQHSFANFKDNCHFILYTKNWVIFIKKLLCLKNFICKQKKRKI